MGQPRRRCATQAYVITASYIYLLSAQDFGARDPTAGEIGSNFTEKVLGNADTSHIIRQVACTNLMLPIYWRRSNAMEILDGSLCRGPKGLEKLVGLATKKCSPCEKGNVQPMSESAAYTLRNQVSGLGGPIRGLIAVHPHNQHSQCRGPSQA